MRKKQPQVRGNISKLLELPQEILEGLPNIELCGNRQAIIEHCQSVLEYSPIKVRINAGKLILEFTGRNLRLECMTDENIIVSGYIISIRLIEQGV